MCNLLINEILVALALTCDYILRLLLHLEEYNPVDSGLILVAKRSACSPALNHMFTQYYLS